jgi:23S rRNA pseudouridine2605 synthase
MLSCFGIGGMVGTVVDMKTSRGPGRVTLPRAISKLGYASRTRAGSLIASGDVKVNGAVEQNPHCWVDLERDRIEVREQKLERQTFRYSMLNKPKGFVTTRSDERGHTTVFDLLGEGSADLIAVGRLDKESTGLLLFTNDHRFAHRVTSPESGLYKTYRVTVDRTIDRKDLDRIAKGVSIHVDGREIETEASVVVLKQPREIEISIREGKNRQIRRMLAEVSYEVVDLQRVAIGSLRLGNLAEGHVRDLAPSELRLLKEAVQPKSVTSVAIRGGRRSKKVFRGNRRIPNR